MMSIVRKPAAAGRFYPEQAGELRTTVRRLLDAAVHAEAAPKAIIVPHAGYVYSGPIAASGHAQLESLRQAVRRVVLIGPAHYVPIRGLAASSAKQFETPLGPIELDTQAIAELGRFPQFQVYDAPHESEHSLEVHLPFLQEALDSFHLVPLVVGQATIEEVAEVIEALWDGPETVFVISSDLSHFHDYNHATQIDRQTSEAIESLSFEQLSGEKACGYLPISGLLSVARRRGLRVKKLDLRNSGDVSGDHSRVVGYGAWLVTDADTETDLTLDDEQTLLQTARDSIRSGLQSGEPLDVGAGPFPPVLLARRATFVTLLRNDQLRGCMGSLSAEESLIANVAKNAYSAAFRDPRFSALQPHEFGELDVHISILGLPEPIPFETEHELLQKIRPGVDGLIVREGKRRGTLLPSVWEHVTDPKEFLGHLKQKANLAANYWSDTLTVERYTAYSVPSKPH